jgi:hypothetical protein
MRGSRAPSVGKSREVAVHPRCVARERMLDERDRKVALFA